MSRTKRTIDDTDDWRSSPDDRLYVYLADGEGNIIQDESGNDIIVKYYDGDTWSQRTSPV